MKTTTRFCFYALLTGLWSLPAIAQSDMPAHEGQPEQESMKGKHVLSLQLAHTHVSQGVQDGESTWLALPSWCFDYDYWIGKRWAIGLHTDIIIESFEVKDHLNTDDNATTTVMERTTPFSAVPMVTFKPHKHSSFMLGAGGEFAKEENLFLMRAGYEWGFELPRSWELNFGVSYDFRWNAYDSFTYGVGISKLLGGHRK